MTINMNLDLMKNDHKISKSESDLQEAADNNLQN